MDWILNASTALTNAFMAFVNAISNIQLPATHQQSLIRQQQFVTYKQQQQHQQFMNNGCYYKYNNNSNNDTNECLINEFGDIIGDIKKEMNIVTDNVNIISKKDVKYKLFTAYTNTILYQCTNE